MKERASAPTRMIGKKMFRLHCTRTIVGPLLEKKKLEDKGYETHMELIHGVWKLWKEVKRE